MKTGLARMLGRNTAWLCCAILLAAVLFGPLSAWALPAKGTPAPPLQFTQLLQAPAGERADWGALRGKVVVLEFWATWCEWCVVEIPHWNKLAASLDPARFQFISVDDENPEVVQNFLAKRKMAGWVGIDTTGRIFRRFGVVPRPTTIIVDGNGRIVAATQPQDIETADLLAVAAGKSVKFKPPPEDIEPLIQAASSAATVKPLYEVSLTKTAPNAKLIGAMSAGPGRMDIYGWSAEDLLLMTYNNIPKDRLVLKNPLPEGLYNLHVVWASADGNSALMTFFLQPVVKFGFNLHVEPKTVMKTVYVLQATATSRKLLTPTAMTAGSWMSTYRNGKVQLVNGSMDDLADALEAGLDIPVVNETDIQGKFDETLEFPAKDADAARASLLKVLQLKLVKEDRPIAMLVVESREDAKKDASEQASKK